MADGTPVANLVFTSQVSSKLTVDVTNMDNSDKGALADAVCTAVKEETQTVAQGAGAGSIVVIDSCNCGGNLDGCTTSVRRRRRLTNRRLASHTGTVATLTKTTVPAVQAAQARAAVQAAVTDTGGALSSALLETAIKAKVAATPALQAKVGNLTVESSTVVSGTSIAPSTGTGTTGGTSGAVTEYLSYAAGLMLGASLLM